MIDQKSTGNPAMTLYFASGCASTSGDGIKSAAAMQPVVVYHPSQPTPLSSLSRSQIDAAEADDKTGTKRSKLWDALQTVRWPAVPTRRRLHASKPHPPSLTWQCQHARWFARWPVVTLARWSTRCCMLWPSPCSMSLTRGPPARHGFPLQAIDARDALPATATTLQKEAVEKAVEKAGADAVESSHDDRTIAPFSVRGDLKTLLQPTVVHMNEGGKDNRVSSMVLHACVTPPNPPAVAEE